MALSARCSRVSYNSRCTQDQARGKLYFMAHIRRWTKAPIPVGETFGTWTVLAPAPPRSYFPKRKDGMKVEHHTVYVRCRCGCGHEQEVILAALRRGKTLGCRDCYLARCVELAIPRSGAQSRGWTGCGRVSGQLFYNTKKNALRRGIPFKLTITAAAALLEAQGGLCALTGWPLHCESARARRRLTPEAKKRVASLDRIDPTKGYVQGNVQWVCSCVNYAKHTLGQQDFLSLVESIYDFTVRKPAL